MLVLTRKKNETIQIGDDIVIKVISTGRGKVKIGIDAPAHVRVLRGELDTTLRNTNVTSTDSTIKV
ncbi:carbon storage regulator CsrA [Thalassoglobus sp. JC818]|uniref:carbon storage regulator CsrA n=1 Tax=Thalassoglobus sp. JC818 TaxID=3232136 RepID=UPI0034591D06